MLRDGSQKVYPSGMDAGPKIAQVAALVGEPARANILACLMGGQALTASELAYVSGDLVARTRPVAPGTGPA